MLLNQKLTSVSAPATCQQPQAPVKEASIAQRHPAAPPSSGLGDHLGGSSGAQARLLSDGSRRYYKYNSKLPHTEHGARKLCWGRGPLWTGLVTSQGDTGATSTIPSLEGEILLSVTLYTAVCTGLLQLCTGNWCPGLLIVSCLLPNL